MTDVEALARTLSRLMVQGDRLSALAQLKASAPTIKLGQRQRLVNSLQKEIRERAEIDTQALAAALADLVPTEPTSVSTLPAGVPTPGGSVDYTAPTPTLAAVSAAATSAAAPATLQPASSPPQRNEAAVYHIFGDSHTHVLAALECSTHAILVYPFVAGSAMGLRRADSRSGYRTALEADLARVGHEDGVVFKFGQVDVDFVYYLKLAEQPGLHFNSFAADSIAKCAPSPQWAASLTARELLPGGRAATHTRRTTGCCSQIPGLRPRCHRGAREARREPQALLPHDAAPNGGNRPASTRVALHAPLHVRHDGRSRAMGS
jgi:hypothetical protein